METSRLLPFETELSKIRKDYTALSKRVDADAEMDFPETFELVELQMRCISAIERAAGRGSLHFEKISAEPVNANLWQHLSYQVGIVRSLLHDIQHGFTQSQEELIHGYMFSDFLEMAEHLLEAHYKDAAAVIAGSTLESHLKQLATKSSISTDFSGRPKKAEALNSELAAASVYSKVDQKNVTAWLGLRNDAAHGNYGAYDEQRIRLFIDSVRFFITQHPA